MPFDPIPYPEGDPEMVPSLTPPYELVPKSFSALEHELLGVEPGPTRVEILERAMADVKEALDQKLSHYALRIAMALSIITKAEEDLEHGQHR
jgi:hypothetical protein